jgi:hypothetical protein
MSEIRQSSSPAVLETPWTEYVEVVLRRRWFVLGGTLAAWALTVPLAFLVPPRFDCVATVALTGLPTPTPPFGEDLVNSASAAAAAPEAIPPEAAATMARDRLAAGISPALYGRLEKTFADASVLRSALGGRFSPGAVQALLSHSPLSPVRNVPVSTLAAAPPAPPLIPAVQVSYSADSAQKAIRGVTALASLVREALVTLTLLDQIEVATFEANSFVVRAHRERLRLAAENESLSLEGAELARLARELPGGRSFTPDATHRGQGEEGRQRPSRPPARVGEPDRHAPHGLPAPSTGSASAGVRPAWLLAERGSREDDQADARRIRQGGRRRFRVGSLPSIGRRGDGRRSGRGPRREPPHPVSDPGPPTPWWPGPGVGLDAGHLNALRGRRPRLGVVGSPPRAALITARAGSCGSVGRWPVYRPTRRAP